MKIFTSTKRNAALTLIELLVVLGVLFIFAALFLVPAMDGGRVRAPRIQCVNNLKQTGLAYRVWEGDNGNKYPMAVSETIGGTSEYIIGPNAFRHFLVMSNELSTPKILVCPADERCIIGTNWNIGNSNISYFVGVDADETNAQMILGGDRNITNGTVIRNGQLEVTSKSPSSWTAEVHNKVGNILMADGSVQQLSIAGLRITVSNTGFPTNRLQMP